MKRERTYSLHRMEQHGETVSDVAALIVGAIQQPQIGLEGIVVNRAHGGPGDRIRVTLYGFANEAEVEDHARRFTNLGATVFEII